MADNLPSGPEFRTGRSDSTTSTSSNTSTTANSNKSGTPNSPPMAPRRRSGHHLFEGLEAQKRSQDPAAVARRQSMSEQRPKVGIIGSMWNNWVHGEK
ncbi:hypothetical protein QBC40DRAFT_249370 [Triangularia verruculosa]|uniref:Conidiation-specific protein 8 n=1 Tax=Triangularia verruculosa TaxID=2587418 RepID=A0AAN6XVL9_9PEZI|nr:hypothetical protein QBC40DRAFT_249370 [Triangularia verruculosa]